MRIRSVESILNFASTYGINWNGGKSVGQGEVPFVG